MARRGIGLGYGWDDERPFLKWRGLWTDEAESVLLVGQIRWRIERGRQCIGYYDGHEDRPCPTRAAVTRGAHCEACLGRDAFRPCMTCDGVRCPPLTPAMRRRCRQDHVLYLACFGDVTVKVGTASLPRRSRRVVEQGPLAAARIARADGPTIKQMERLLSAGAFTETMRRGKKTDLLRAAMTEAEAQAVVAAAAETVRDALPLHHQAALHAPEWVELPPLARQSRGLAVQPLQLADDVVISGDVVGAVGHVVFLRDPDGTFALDLGDLKGRVIDLAPEGAGPRPVVQLGLF